VPQQRRKERSCNRDGQQGGQPMPGQQTQNPGQGGQQGAQSDKPGQQNSQK
jgi:hypothetical protein